MHQLAAGLLVEFDHLGHVLGDQIHMFHGKHRQFQPDHAANLTRPEPRSVDDVLGSNLPLVRHHPPHAVRQLDELLHLGVEIDFRPVLLRRFRIGVCRAVRIEMALMRIKDGADEFLGIEKRHHLMRLFHRHEPRLAAGIFPLGE
ncbi:hypothetical protein D3C87_1647960 [compost metagenome]